MVSWVRKQLTTHEVTLNKRDQYAALIQPEEFHTIPVRAELVRIPGPEPGLSFKKFNFDKERLGCSIGLRSSVSSVGLIYRLYRYKTA